MDANLSRKIADILQNDGYGRIKVQARAARIIPASSATHSWPLEIHLPRGRTLQTREKEGFPIEQFPEANCPLFQSTLNPRDPYALPHFFRAWFDHLDSILVKKEFSLIVRSLAAAIEIDLEKVQENDADGIVKGVGSCIVRTELHLRHTQQKFGIGNAVPFGELFSTDEWGKISNKIRATVPPPPPRNSGIFGSSYLG